MNLHSRTLSSAYMHWAKSQGSINYNLAVSGIPDYPLNEIPYRPEDIVLSGSGSYGYPPLLQAIASRYNISPDSVVTTLGASMANYLVMALLLQPGDEVLIEHPAYELFVSTAMFLGASVKRFERKFENGFQVKVTELEKIITPKTKLIVVTNLHNPTSVYTDEKSIKQLGELARSAGAKVLVGEVYLNTVFDRNPFTALHLGDEFITTNSLTKAYGLSGLRLGWICAEPEIARKLWRMIDLLYVNHGTLSERLGVRAFEYLETIVARSKAILDTNRALFNKFLDERNDIECISPEYGTVRFPRLKHGNVDRLVSVLRSKYDTLVAPGSYFEMPEHFRIGLCCKPEIFEEGLKRLGRGLDEV
ncbi:MAG: aminotransferase class I/II-fold pyridoxal phosphate-dependent enzyme [Bacteroidetes bacterium]|nr:MAG: aminotransferase class I/II-fold pyridoxal phosphate-dependent enzyme [Bacteroidota bacterium]